jgi:hypothetical protein
VTEDRELSPYTGWTRAHWERLADDLLLAVRPFATPGHALVHLPGPASRSGRWSDALEGFARTFLLAGFRRGDHAEWYAAGLAAGSDPGSEERWPRPDEIPQARVEAASIALALHESGLWPQLDARVQEQLVDWLGHMRRVGVPANNWVWFRAVVSTFLRAVGAEWSPEDLEEAAGLTDAWYRGDGWYTDGEGRNFDYYNGWALHFYPLWLSRISGEPPDDRYTARLHRFLEDAQHLVAADGAPLLQGRSLTYRFAMLAPFWTGTLFGATPLSPGRTRRLASGVLRHFAGHGCIDERGLLPLGWHRAFPAMRQTYSGPGSPYWAAKGFAGLVLPADHPVWTAVEEPLELERHDVERVIAAPGWLVSGAKGIVRVANHGTAKHDDPLYSLHGYSTHAAPPVAGEPDVTLLDEHGVPTPRGAMELLHLAPRQALSRSEDGRLTTASVLHGPWEVRLARMEWGGEVAGGGGEPATRRPSRLRVSGFALAGEPRGGAVRRGELVSAVTPLRGFGAATTRTRYGADPFGDPAFIPYVEAGARPGEVYAALVTLGRDVPTNVTLRDGVVRFPDGVSERVELVPQPGGDVQPGEVDRLGDPFGR